MEKIYREFKSNSFSMLMKEKKYALETYNNLNNSSYENPDEVEIIEIDGGISLTIRNDATFIIDSVINLYEQQSTVNENMALRQLLYIANIYKYLTKHDNIYKKNQIKLPTPRFIVFYNGPEDYPEMSIQKLSDSFILEEKDPWLELKCVVYNINDGYNEKLKEKSSGIRGYMIYVDKVRRYQLELDLKDAIEKAIDECVEEGILSEFFKEYKDMIVSADAIDCTYERRLEFEIKEAREYGMAQGMENIILNALRGGSSPEEISRVLHMPIEKILSVQAKMLEKV